MTNLADSVRKALPEVRNCYGNGRKKLPEDGNGQMENDNCISDRMIGCRLL